MSQQILNALLKIRENPVERQGICTQLAREAGMRVMDANYIHIQHTLNQKFRSWIHFSGDSDLPVPSTDCKKSPFEMYLFCTNYWDIETEYGRLRWHLLEHLINEYSK